MNLDLFQFCFKHYHIFLKNNFTEYNLSKSISACVLAQKKTSKSFDLEKSKKYCEETVRKQKEAY